MQEENTREKLGASQFLVLLPILMSYFISQMCYIGADHAKQILLLWSHDKLKMSNFTSKFSDKIAIIIIFLYYKNISNRFCININFV